VCVAQGRRKLGDWGSECIVCASFGVVWQHSQIDCVHTRVMIDCGNGQDYGPACIIAELAVCARRAIFCQVTLDLQDEQVSWLSLMWVWAILTFFL